MITVLSRASAHGRSQLKRQNLGMDGYTEKVLKWFNYPQARALPRCQLSWQPWGRINRLASSVRSCFVEASPTVEKAVSCYKADRLVAVGSYTENPEKPQNCQKWGVDACMGIMDACSGQYSIAFYSTL